MATQADVRRIALSLPDTVEAEGHFAFSVMNRGKARGYAWAWNEHYDGFPAVLVRLEAVAVDELEALITSAWRCQAPKATRSP